MHTSVSTVSLALFLWSPYSVSVTEFSTTSSTVHRRNSRSFRRVSGRRPSIGRRSLQHPCPIRYLHWSCGHGRRSEFRHEALPLPEQELTRRSGSRLQGQLLGYIWVDDHLLLHRCLWPTQNRQGGREARLALFHNDHDASPAGRVFDNIEITVSEPAAVVNVWS